MESVGEYEYNTKDLVGHGAFAVVFKGRHKKNHNHVVAVKCVSKKNIGKSAQFLGKEIKILQEVTKLHHKNVVALLECVERPQHLYIVIEYCNGGDLSEYLNAMGTLSEDTIRLFFSQIAEAMKVLNAKDVVHRDLKPQNILLCHSGKPKPAPEEITLKIADFGFARFLQDGVMAATLCGSPMYMAPEVLMNKKYDAKADLWSIGTIVFQCLTGKAPFTASSPPALKHFYEKNVKLAPKIPSGTSQELTDLLLGLMKRDSKDRMDFDQFFNHRFLKIMPRCSSPVPVPSRRSLSPLGVPPTRASPVRASPAHVSPFGSPSPPQCWDRNVGGEDMAQSPSSLSMSPLHSPKTLAHEQGKSSPLSSLVEQGFVVIPHNTVEMQKNCGAIKTANALKHQLSDPNWSPSKIPVTNSPTRKLNNNANINIAAKVVAHQATKISPEECLRPASLPMDVPNTPPSSSPDAFCYHFSGAIPVPTQKEAYEQIEHSLHNTPISSPHDDFDSAKKMSSSSSTPTSSKEPSFPRSDPIPMHQGSVNSLDSDTLKMADISSFSPPAVQFTIGTPPLRGRLRSYSGSTPPPGSGRQTPTGWRQQTPPASQTPICGSPQLCSRATPPLNCYMPSNSISPLRGSPAKDLWRGDQLRCHTEPSLAAMKALDYRNVNNSPCPLRVAFGGRTMTLPEFGAKDLWPNGTIQEMDDHEYYLQRSGSSGRLSEPGAPRNQLALSGSGGSLLPFNHQHRPFSQPTCQYCWNCVHGSPARSRRNSSGACIAMDSSPTNCCFPYGTSPQYMEQQFVAPELTEETVLEKEHNETLAKLNFVSALVKCILELAKTQSSPLAAALTDTFSRSANPDQMMNEGYRQAVQLLLYMKALQLLSSSLQLSRQEVQSGHLQPSSSVRSVLQTMKEDYHFCLSMCKGLNSPGLLQSVGVDPALSNITADKILYNYAIEMCQSAALEELFGDPKESFRRYQTAQILLHSLGQQIEDPRDKGLLNKYRDAVERRLIVLSYRGYAFAYDTT